MPSFLSAVMTRFIDSAAAARAAFTVGFVTDTPSRRSATSGLITTRPVPLTLMVCSGAWSVAASAFRGAKTGLATAATIRPMARPTPIQRIRAVGRVNVIVVGCMGGTP